MKKNRSNRPAKDLPMPMEGRKYKCRKCHCKECCGGHKRNTIAEQEKHWTKWNLD